MDTQTAANEQTAPLPPVAPRRPSQRTLHGVMVADDYAWLKDANWQEVLRNGDAMAKGLPYFDFGGTRHSPDHRLEAWSADVRGSEFFTIRVRDWQTGADLPDVIEQTGGSVVWGLDSSFFYYVRLDDNHR